MSDGHVNRCRLANHRRQVAKSLLLKGASMTDALRGAGYAESTCNHQSPDIVGPIRNDLAKALERQGLTDEKLAEYISKVLVASDGKRPNWPCRLGAIRIAVDVRGDKAPTQVNVNSHLTVEQVRVEQNRLVEALTWLE